MRKNSVMTEKQKEYAAAHHNLVYKYLHLNNLDVDDYYDIVVLGYLRAVVKYDKRSDLRKYSFTTIAWMAMNTDLRNYKKYMNRVKRKADVLSLDAALTDSKGFFLLDTLAADDNPAQDLDNKLICLEVFSRLNENQRRIIQMRLMGYPKLYISRKLRISFHEIDTALLDIWNIIRGLFSGATDETDSETSKEGA